MLLFSASRCLQIRETATGEWDAAAVHALLLDVPNYPTFLPFVKEVTALDAATDARRHIYRVVVAAYGLSADADFAVAPSAADDPVRTVHMDMVRGPCRRYEGSWRIQPMRNGDTPLQVELALDMVFHSHALALAARGVVPRLKGAFMEAFVHTANHRCRRQ